VNKDYVCGFYADGQRVALMRKVKPEWQRNRLNGIGGKIEPGEHPAEAMAREFKEETGRSTDPADWTLAVVMVGDGWRVHFFSASGPAFDLNETDCDPLHVASGETMEWHEKGALPDAVMPNLKWLIPMAFDTDLCFPLTVRDKSNPETDGATVSGR
jgi:8-oxo-dGTP diphosphatase